MSLKMIAGHLLNQDEALVAPDLLLEVGLGGNKILKVVYLQYPDTCQI